MLNARCACEGNYFLFYQALANLLQNALDFSPVNGVIDINARREAALVIITVRDHGSGIPDFAREKIFEKFYSLERPDTQRKSTGLGLAFVKLVVELHDGSIGIEPRAGGGTEVKIVFR
ncbi:MAG: ATP-binding protein [Turneriella sp.]